MTALFMKKNICSTMEKRKQILAAFAADPDKVLTSQQIYSSVDTHEFYRPSHLSKILTRMVKSGHLIRIKKGLYKLGPISGSTRKKVEEQPANQTKLF